MKKFSAIFLAALLLCSGCSNEKSYNKNSNASESGALTPSNSSSASASYSERGSENSANDLIEEQSTAAPSENEGSRILIAYFTVPEDDVDTVSRASVVVKDGKKFGNTEYVANVVQQTIGGDLFHIETVREYTHDHDALTDYAADEKADNARPELKNHIDNISKYDIIILGYPNWWADLPMPVYTFLKEYDFGGKTIIPFVTHGGSGFSNTRKTIADLQPNAAVSDNSLNLSRNNILENEDEIIQWAKSLI